MHKEWMKPSLVINYVWGDESVAEFRISASDGEYAGTTHIYASHDFAVELAERLQSFSRSVSQVVEKTIGEPGGHSYLRLCFRRIHGAGHLRVEVEMEKSTHQDGAHRFRPRVMLSFLFEAAALDTFVGGLRSLGQMCKDSVQLVGREA